MNEIEALQAQVAELTRERDEAISAAIERGCNATTRQLENQLASCQAQNVQLRELLNEVIYKVGLSPHGGLASRINGVLAQPQDRSALDELLKAKRNKIADHPNLFLSERQREIIRSMK